MNHYCYCGNDPINFVDPSGSSAILTTMLIGFAIGGGFDIGKQIYANGWNPADWNWRQIGTISSKAYAIADMSAKQKSLTIWNMIGMDNFARNAYKSWGYEQVFDFLMLEATNQLAIYSIENLTRYIVYSAVVSSLMSGWY